MYPYLAALLSVVVGPELLASLGRSKIHANNLHTKKEGATIDPSTFKKLLIYLIHIPLLIVYLKLLIRLLFHKVTQC